MTPVVAIKKQKVEEERLTGLVDIQVSPAQQEILNKITELERQLANVKGTKCEVYSRIVGYFRPVKNWNEGKQAEYKDRVVYEVNSEK